MKQRTFVSPDGRHRRVTESPAVAVRLRSRGWTEQRPKPADKPKSEPKDKPDA